MNMPFLYKNKKLGYLGNDDYGRMFFVANNLECLIELFGIKSNEEIEIGVYGKNKYRFFEDNLLPQILYFYPNDSARSLKEDDSRDHIANLRPEE